MENKFNKKLIWCIERLIELLKQEEGCYYTHDDLRPIYRIIAQAKKKNKIN
jgi:hypothetical protein